MGGGVSGLGGVVGRRSLGRGVSLLAHCERGTQDNKHNPSGSPKHEFLSLVGSNIRLGCDGEPAPIAKGLGGDLESGRCLLPLVFGALHHADDPFD